MTDMTPTATAVSPRAMTADDTWTLASTPAGSAKLEDRPRRLALRTQMRLRWLAILGQAVTVLLVWLGLGFPFPVGAALTVIACSAVLNLLFELRRTQSLRLTTRLALWLLVFDVVQLAALLFLTGGAENPFVMLMIGPVVISATTLPGKYTMILAALALALVTVLTIVSYPLPWWPDEPIVLPDLLVLGNWTAVACTLGFAGVYTWRVAEEGRQLEGALAATELALEREQHLSALDGLAAAAAHELGTPLATISLVSRELERGLPEGSPLAEDVALLREQAQRCREILRRLTSLSSHDEHLARLALSALVEEVVEPQREFGVEIDAHVQGEGPEPVSLRNAGVMHGLGNLMENSVDFAQSRVTITGEWSSDRVSITIADDGPGFSPDLIGRIGEPYISRRRSATEAAEELPYDEGANWGSIMPGTGQGGGGLGLGLFIATTLLERSGASVRISEASFEGKGATVNVLWPREVFERR